MKLSSREYIAQQTNYRKQIVSPYLLFLLWPFLSFFYAVKYFRYTQSRIIVILFFCFFGLTISLKSEGIDGYRQAQRFIRSSELNFAGFVDKIIRTLSQQSENDLDIYTDTVNFLFSIITDNPQFVFAFHALIFGIFSISVFAALQDEFGGSMDKRALIFFVLILFINPINNIHAIRFPIASWVFIFGAYRFLRFERRVDLVWCLLAALIHFSFLAAFAVVVIYSFLGNRLYLYLGILLVSYIAPSVLNQYLIGFDSVPISEGIRSKITDYSREEYVTARNSAIESRNWYVRLRIPILHYTFIAGFFYTLFLAKRGVVRDKIQENLICFSILFLAFVNFGFEFDSLGRRFLLVWIVFASIYMYRYYQLNREIFMIKVPLLFIFPVGLWIIVQVRIFFETMNVMWIFGNLFLVISEDIDVRFIDLF